MAVVFPGVVAANAIHVNDIVAPSSGQLVDENDTLYLERSEAAYLSRIYSERDHEIAFCGLVDRDERPRLEVWMADTVQASPGMIQFLTNNCPSNTEALIHTHPSGDLQLSEPDKHALRESPEEIMCVQGGPLETPPGTFYENIACYRDQQDGGVSDIQIGVKAIEDVPLQ